MLGEVLTIFYFEFILNNGKYKKICDQNTAPKRTRLNPNVASWQF